MEIDTNYRFEYMNQWIDYDYFVFCTERGTPKHEKRFDSIDGKIGQPRVNARMDCIKQYSVTLIEDGRDISYQGLLLTWFNENGTKTCLLLGLNENHQNILSAIESVLHVCNMSIIEEKSRTQRHIDNIFNTLKSVAVLFCRQQRDQHFREIRKLNKLIKSA